MITSTQTHYDGQQGWNDCLPSTFIGAKKTPFKNPTKRYQSSSLSSSSCSLPLVPPPVSTSTPNLNQLPPPPVSAFKSNQPPPMISTPSSCSSVSLESSKKSDSEDISDSCNTSTSTTPISETSQEGESMKSSTLDSVLSNLNKLLEASTELPAREFSHYKTRLEKNVPELANEHLAAIDSSLEQLFSESLPAEERKNNAREVIVQHMMIHSAVSTWAIPLRKVIEKVQLK